MKSRTETGGRHRRKNQERNRITGMKLYSTVRGEASAEQLIEKSRFITYVSPAQTKDEAEMFIAAIRKKHKDATHNVPAMVLGDKQQIQWGSDDGEPQGTSGAPIVQMLVAQGITNVVVVVTRYFGGIKLGTGGLVRAYTSSAKLGLEAAGICDVCERSVLTYSVDYTYLTKLQNLAESTKASAVDYDGAEDRLFTIEKLEYTDVVQAELSCVPERVDELKLLIANLTAGQGRLIAEESRIVKV